jgi:hypothetical protein
MSLNYQYIQEARAAAIDAINTWAHESPTSVLQLTPAQNKRMMQLSYIEGYWRIRQTTPLILQAIRSLTLHDQHKAANFWIEHLSEEASHDNVMLDDLYKILGGKAAAEATLKSHPMTPPSAALIGYFDWQTRHGNPHLLIAFRDFLENFLVGMTNDQVSSINSLATDLQTLDMHRELDTDHVTECRAYTEQHFQQEDTGQLVWTTHFIGHCLRDSQIWAAKMAQAELP